MARSADGGAIRAGGAGAVPDRRDPLRFLASEFDPDADVWRSASGRLCVAGPDAARAVLGNRDGAFVETSDFFHTRTGVFGPRAAQAEIGRSARALLHRHLRERRADLPRLVRARLAPESRWPDAANLLVREHLRDVLLCPDAPAELHDVVDGIVARAVLAGARARHSAVSRLVFRRRAMRALAREIGRRRVLAAAGGPGEPRDLLDVTLWGACAHPPGHGAADSAALAELAEVYLSFLFAAVGSTGFALAWSVYLAGTAGAGAAEDEPGWIVREALRLWPVAWLFSRTAARPHELAGVPVAVRDEVAVCLWLVHRHPGHWERPDAFVPRRWAEPVPAPAFLPFGFGAHACAGATAVLALVEDVVRVVTRDWHLTVADTARAAGGDVAGGAVQLGPALAPPAFTVRLRPRGGATRRGGERP